MPCVARYSVTGHVVETSTALVWQDALVLLSTVAEYSFHVRRIDGLADLIAASPVCGFLPKSALSTRPAPAPGSPRGLDGGGSCNGRLPHERHARVPGSRQGTADSQYRGLDHGVAPLAAVVLVPYVLRGCGRQPGWLALSESAGAAYAITGITTALIARSLVESRVLLAAGVGVLTAFCGGVGFLSETLALGEGRVTAVVPVLAAIDTVVPIVSAPWLFHESWSVGLRTGLMLATGFVLAGVGIAGLATAMPLSAGDRCVSSSASDVADVQRR